VSGGALLRARRRASARRRLRFFVGNCHQAGIGVILDWVLHEQLSELTMGGLRRFDGSALYEARGSARGRHPDWHAHLQLRRRRGRVVPGPRTRTLVHDVHVTGSAWTRLASMLYRDYSRSEGQMGSEPLRRGARTGGPSRFSAPPRRRRGRGARRRTMRRSPRVPGARSRRPRVEGAFPSTQHQVQVEHGVGCTHTLDY